jgi:hypothetical protein
MERIPCLLARARTRNVKRSMGGLAWLRTGVGMPCDVMSRLYVGTMV